MTSYRNSKLVERYEDVVFEFNKALNTDPGNGNHQTKEGYRFTVDNTGESIPLDWYHARFNVDINLDRLDSTPIAADDQAGIVNSASSLIKKLNVKMNGIDVYNCSDANHVTNVKNLLEYSQGYAKRQGTNEFFYLDVNRHAEDRVAQVANYNRDFAARKALLNADATVNAEIPFNRYGFFESLHGELLPNSRIAVIAVDPAIIYSFVKKVCKRGKRVNALINTMQIDPLASFVCQTAENSNNSY